MQPKENITNANYVDYLALLANKPTQPEFENLGKDV